MNIAVVLKGEIARIARKEVRVEADPLRRSSSQYRSEIASLKKRLAVLESQVRRLQKTKLPQAAQSDASGSSNLRFRKGGFGTLRKKLGLSAADMGLLLGVSNQSVYKWEQGTAHPRASQLPAIAAVRQMGKREVAAKLESLRQA